MSDSTSFPQESSNDSNDRRNKTVKRENPSPEINDDARAAGDSVADLNLNRTEVFDINPARRSNEQGFASPSASAEPGPANQAIPRQTIVPDSSVDRGPGEANGPRTEITGADRASGEQGSTPARAPTPTMQLGEPLELDDSRRAHDSPPTSFLDADQPPVETPTMRLGEREPSGVGNDQEGSSATDNVVPTMILGQSESPASGSTVPLGDPETATRPVSSTEQSGQPIPTMVLGSDYETEPLEQPGSAPGHPVRTMVLDDRSNTRAERDSDPHRTEPFEIAPRGSSDPFNRLLNGGVEQGASTARTTSRPAEDVSCALIRGASQDRLVRRTTSALAFAALAILISVTCALISPRANSITYACAVTALIVGIFSFLRYGWLLRKLSRA